ncbi:Adenosine deaminase [Streptomyces fumanus]
MTSQTTAKSPTPDQIRRAPKVLLHDHLDGGLRPGTVVELARETGYSGLPETDPEKLGVWFRRAADSGSLERYLETFSTPSRVMQTRDALVRVAAECAEDLAADGVVYAEVRYAPEQHLEQGLTLEQVVEAVDEGFREGERRARGNGHRIRVGALLTAMRHAARALEIAELANRYRDRGVVGFDIAGAEAGYPPTRHLDAFEYLKRENNHFTIHAGEAFGLPSIWQALQWCGADRLGHGVRIIDDIQVQGGRHRRPGAARLLRTGQAHPAGAVPQFQPPDRGGGLVRRAPDRAAARAALPGHREHRQPAHVAHQYEPGIRAPCRRLRLHARRHAMVLRQCDEISVHSFR